MFTGLKNCLVACGKETLTVSSTAVNFADIPGTLRVGPITYNSLSSSDITITGTSFSRNESVDFKIMVDGTGTPDTFKWSDDGGTNYNETTVDMTGAAQNLNNGVTATWLATTGHTATTDYLTFTVYPKKFAELPNLAVVKVAGDQIRAWCNGDTPTSSVGMLYEVGDEFEIVGKDNIRNFKAIRVTADATLSIQYYR